jgi:hypothetical protein
MRVGQLIDRVDDYEIPKVVATFVTDSSSSSRRSEAPAARAARATVSTATTTRSGTTAARSGAGGVKHSSRLAARAPVDHHTVRLSGNLCDHCSTIIHTLLLALILASSNVTDPGCQLDVAP